MNKKLEQRLRAKLKPMIETILREEESWSGSDTKIADAMIQALSKVPYPNHSTNDTTIKETYQEISLLRRDLMAYVEKRSGMKYKSTSGSTWKLSKGI